MSDISDSVRQQIRQLLSQGYRVGLEYADARRFRTGSWQSASVAQGSESTVLSGIAAVLDEHQGEYVQLLGVDTHSRTRVLELMIQRPDGAVTKVSSTKINGGKTIAAAASNGSAVGGGSDVAQSVRQLLSQGYRIGTEFADARHYRATSWTSGPSYQGTREGEAIAMLNELVAAHENDYVRMIGIDSQARRRVMEVIIHKPGEPATLSTSTSTQSGSFSSSFGGSSSSSSNVKTSLSAEVVASVRRLLENSYQISTEHADIRRFRSSSWHTCKPVSATRLQEAVAQLETCLMDHEGEYVRLIGIDRQAKRRVHEEIIQRPQQR
jgi:carbon dioxide concentrating mechanism protein CcmM